MGQKSWGVVVLAAGKGSRMKSDLPKVLHPVLGKPMLVRILETLETVSHRLATRSIKLKICVVLGKDQDPFQSVKEMFTDVLYTTQDVPKGTGHALQCALNAFVKHPAERIMVCAGDTPLLDPELLTRFMLSACDAMVLGMKPPHPTGYGRLMMGESHEGSVTEGVINDLYGIKEERDLLDKEKSLSWVNSGVMQATYDFWSKTLPELKPNNAQGEWYLTDTIMIGRSKGFVPKAFLQSDFESFLGVNDQGQRSYLEGILIEKTKQAHEKNGAYFVHKSSSVIGTQMEVGLSNAFHGPCVLMDGVTEQNVSVGPFTYVEKALLGQGSKIGPYVMLLKEH